MVRVVGIDHISIRVSDYEKSKAFYDKLLKFLGFKVLGDYGDQIGWTNGKTRYWIGKADSEAVERGYRIGDVGLHHYAFELRNRKDVDDLQSFLKEEGVTIVDPANEYYDDYYAVFFLDPDGLKLEGMKWGEAHEKAAQARKRARGQEKGCCGSEEKGAAAANPPNRRRPQSPRKPSKPAENRGLRPVRAAMRPLNFCCK